MYRFCRLLILLLLLTVALLSCSGQQPATPTPDFSAGFSDGLPFYAAQIKPEGDMILLQALLLGVLSVEDGCLRLVAPSQKSSLVLWVPTVQINPTSATDLRSGATATFGTPIQGGGGHIPEGARLLANLQAPIPANCPGPYVMMHSIVPIKP